MGFTQRNIEIDSNVWNKLKSEAMKRNKNVRGFAGEILTDYIKVIGRKDKRKKIKAIILAAGMSSRLMELTDDKPKCMIEVNGKTILQRQIEILKECGIDDIIVIRGYKKEAINYTGVKYVYNQNYRRNNILESLMHAESEMSGDFIVLYSDILFTRDVVEKLLRSKSDISVVVDRDWLSNYKDRSQHPVEEAEKVIVKNGRVIKIGKLIKSYEAGGEFIGMAKFSSRGSNMLKNIYRELKEKLGYNSPFHEAAVFEKAYLTDMIQEMINRNIGVAPINISGGWIELDTIEDFQRAEKVTKECDFQ